MTLAQKTFARFGIDWNRLSGGMNDGLLVACTIVLVMVLVGTVVAMIAAGLGIGALFLGGATSGSFPAWQPLSSLILAIAALGAIAGGISRVLEIIGTIARGEPFAAANAGRIERIAVYLLELWVIGWLARWLDVSIGGDINGFDISVSIGANNIAFALVLFVLARIFRHGNRLESDVEGTV
jgi:hypothetical protein